MNWLVLYLLILKATVTSFNGPTSLPVLRDELVQKHKLLTDSELNSAVTTAQTAPGPMGIYVVSVGYFVSGFPGALAGYLALITPAILMVPIVRYLGGRVAGARAKAILDGAVLASAGLVFTSAGPLARDAITGWFPGLIAALSFLVGVSTRISTLWVIVGAGAIGAAVRLLGVNL